MPDTPNNSDPVKVPISFGGSNADPQPEAAAASSEPPATARDATLPQEPALPPATEPAAPVVPAPDPAKPAFSPLTQPFDSGGGPPPIEPVKTKRAFKAPLIIGLIIVLLAGACYAAYAYYTQSVSQTAAKTASTPTPATQTDDLEASARQLDIGIGDLGTNLNDADSTLDDKQGDLSE